MSHVKNARIYIVSNHEMRARKSQEAKHLKPMAVEVQFVSTLMHLLLKVPDGSRILIIDYATGVRRECICNVARLMIKRGNFEEVKV